MSDTEFVVYCPAHRHYLKHASAAGTTWCDDQEKAARFLSKAKARQAAVRATWLDHNPTPWPVAETTAEFD